MAGLDPAIHALKTWMPATSAGMTTEKPRVRPPYSRRVSSQRLRKSAAIAFWSSVAWRKALS
jgi:hypothetical protein